MEQGWDAGVGWGATQFWPKVKPFPAQNHFASAGCEVVVFSSVSFLLHCRQPSYANDANSRVLGSSDSRSLSEVWPKPSPACPLKSKSLQAFQAISQDGGEILPKRPRARCAVSRLLGIRWNSSRASGRSAVRQGGEAETSIATFFHDTRRARSGQEKIGEVGRRARVGERSVGRGRARLARLEARVEASVPLPPAVPVAAMETDLFRFRAEFADARTTGSPLPNRLEQHFVHSTVEEAALWMRCRQQDMEDAIAQSSERDVSRLAHVVQLRQWTQPPSSVVNIGS